MTIGSRMLEALEERNMTQKQLARELNIAVSTINGYIRNYRQPDLSTLILIAKCLDVTSDYLLGLSDIAKHQQGIRLNKQEIELVRVHRQMTSDQKELIQEQQKVMHRQNIRKKLRQNEGSRSQS